MQHSVESTSQRIAFVLEGTRGARRRRSRRGRQVAWAVPSALVLTWLVVVVAMGWLPVVADHWHSSLTMVAGSFLAGATPQGGGAVAFPVFTKGLGVDPGAARTFALSIQAVGMGAAAVTIVATGRTVDWRALRVALPPALGGFLVGLLLWETVDVPSAAVKVGFSLMVAMMALAVWRVSRAPVKEQTQVASSWTPWLTAYVGAAGAAGGVAAAAVGSGVDVALYLALAGLAGVQQRTAVATSVVAMAVVSVVGLAALGLVDGQLFDLGANGVGSLWLAAVPVVAFGAPLGAWAVSRWPARRIARVVLLCGLLEVVTTAVFVPELWTDLALGLGAALGVAAVVAVVWVVGPALRRVARPDRAAAGRVYRRGELVMSTLEVR